MAVAGHLFRFLHLADDLRLSEHHGVESGGDAEGVARGLFLIELVDVRLKFSALHRLHIDDVGEDGFAGLLDVLDGRIDFRSVAGRENGRFVNSASGGFAAAREEMRNEVGDFVRAECHAFADGKRRRGMVEA